VLDSPVNILLNQQLREVRWENWLAKLQEYDLDIKPMKVFEGKGRCKFMTRIEFVNIYPPNTIDVIIRSTSLTTSEWCKDIIFYLRSRPFFLGMSSKERRALKMKTNQYVLALEVLF